MEVLDRLAQAASEPDAPDSMEFAPVSWRELDRDSLTEGLSDLLAYQEQRVKEEERAQIEELRKQAVKRARQREEARRWEHELTDRNRAESLERRIEEARERAASEARDELADKRRDAEAELRARAHEQAWEREITEVTVARSKKRWAFGAQMMVAAAALVGVVWVSAFDSARSGAGQELADQWAQAQEQELGALTRVAELEAEIERRVNLTESERVWLETELGDARKELAELEEKREAVDGRRSVPRPSKMAKQIVPIKKSTASSEVKDTPKPAQTNDTVRVATDEAQGDGCLPYDPLCFNL